MRFGGHETFAIREGWFAKIINALEDCPDIFISDFPEDYLGVGRNMAKSMKHWMVATGVALKHGAGRNIEGYSLSPFGKLISDYDPHLMTQSVWQMIHVNLVNNPEHAASWYWFFNSWTQQRFARNVCIEGLRRYMNLQSKRTPKHRTLERDIACMLTSYAKPVSAQSDDPEDATECPLRDLGIMQYFKGSGTFLINRGKKSISAPVLGYSIAMASDSEELSNHKQVQYGLQELERLQGGPGRCFMMTAESIYELSQEHLSGRSKPYAIENYAGERVLKLKNRSLEKWAEDAFKLEGSYAAI